ncbi:MAG: hypothetical protein U0354_13800 [Candidatus Sericytochromatia bacterium]
MLEVGQTPVYNNTTVGSTTPQAGTDPVTRTDTFTQVGTALGNAAAGGAASFKFSATFSNSLKSTITSVKTTEGGFGAKTKAALPGIKEMGLATVKGGGIAALVSGITSAVTNGVDVLRGKKTGAEAVGTFAADTVNGTIGGMAGVATGGLATMALSSMLGATPLMVVGVGVGALTAVLSDKLFKKSGAYDGIRNAAINATSQK